jgi:hypothetical protein
MEPGTMETYTYPPEHVGVTWFVIISPILLLLLIASIQHYYKNPPDMLVTLYNALLRTKSNLLYIQSLELENARLRKLNAALLDDDDAETIHYEPVKSGDNEKHFYLAKEDPTPKAWQDK